MIKLRIKNYSLRPKFDVGDGASLGVNIKQRSLWAKISFLIRGTRLACLVESSLSIVYYSNFDRLKIKGA